MSAKHLASCGSIGWSGRRVGTTYAHTPRAALSIYSEPWFRFRNEECERICREAWKEPAPTASRHFVATELATPDHDWTTSDLPDELARDELVQWERQAYRNARLHQFNTRPDLFQIYQKRADYCWHPVGRVFQITAAGECVLKASRHPVASDGEGKAKPQPTEQKD